MPEMLGLGHDVVDVPAFAEQLAEPGSRMRALFSTRELRQAAMRGQAKHDGEAVHLAARWAGKESVVKAWCEALALTGSAGGVAAAPPYTLEGFPWSGIEILDDSRGVPRVALRADVDRALRDSLCEPAGKSTVPVWHISLSHDGPIASAVAVLATLDAGQSVNT